jgi:hypothetical protein
MTMKLVGADFLSKAMKEFGPTVAERAGRKGVAKAAQLVRRTMRKAAPTGETKNLKKSIGYKTYGRAGGGAKQAYVGLRKIRGESRGRWYYRTLEVDHKRGKAYNPFFVDAWESCKDQAASLIVVAATTAIYTEADKVYQKSVRDQSRYGFRQGRTR